MKINIEGNLITTTADSDLHVVISGARGPQGEPSPLGVPYTGATQDVNLGEFGLQTGNIEFDNTPTNTPTTDGSLYWDDTSGTLSLRLKGGNVISKVGETQHIRAYNDTGNPIAKGKVVYVTGAQGQRLTIDLADADTELLSKDTIGITAEAIADGAEGFVIVAGILTNINTNGLADGDTVYLSQTAGSYTNVAPADPAHLVILGFVVNGNSGGAGSIYVKVDNGYELEELHNVSDAAKTSVVDNDAFLLRDSADNNLWKRLTWSNFKTAVKTYLDTFKGVAGGYASLDGSGKVPASELPSYVDDVIEVADYASLPATGETGKIYVTLDDSKVYRWSGSVYIQIVGATAWGSITGTLSNQTDLQTALNAKQDTLTNPVTGTGASGQVSYWTGTGTQGGSNNLFWDAANNRLGIGTNAPSGLLDIIGSLVTARFTTTGHLSLIGTGTAASAQTILTLSTGVGNTTGPNIILSKARGQSNDVITTGDSLGTIQFQGANGTATLVSATIQSIAEGLFSSTSRPSYLGFFTTGTTTTLTEKMRIFGNGNLSIQNGGTFTDNGQRLQVYGSTLLRGSGTTSATTALLVQNATPTNLLQVLDNGRINQTLEGSASSTAFGTGALSVATGVFNGAFGSGALQFVTSGTNNNAFGFRALRNNITGSGNTAFGHTSLLNTTSSNNTAFGSQSGLNTTTGANNTFIGGESGINTTTGANNTFIGSTSGYSNISGDNNTALGFNAGRYAGSGTTANETSSSSIYVGYQSRASASGNTNEIVIGYNVVGNGSNTTTIGNTSTTQTHLYGNLTLGTTTSGGRLTVQGSGTTSATTALLVQNSTPTDLFQIKDNGQLLLGNNANGALIFPSNTNGTLDIAGLNTTFYTSVTSQNYGIGAFNFSGTTLGTTSGFNTQVSITRQFAPTSGNAAMYYLTISPTINQTGGANGITRGLVVVPSLTSAADWRSIEWSNNTGWGLYGTGTAANYLAGNTAIGTTTTSGGRLTVRGSGTTSATTALLVQNATPTNLLQVLDNGRISQTLEGSANSTAFGTDALRVATGGDNVGIGTSAGFSNSTGNSNVYVGRSSGTFNTTGSNNIFLGRNSGRFISDSVTANTISNNSIFIGNNTQAAADNQTNQIVIGYLTTGLGSNTTVLGGPSTGQTHLYGNLTLGTTTSGGRLTVQGSGTTSAANSLLVEDSAGTDTFVIRNDGGYAFKGGTVGLAQTGYTTFTNLTTDRTCDANATTVEELADILGTLIEDLKTKGIISA